MLNVKQDIFNVIIYGLLIQLLPVRLTQPVNIPYPYNPQGAKQHGNKIGMLVSSFLENSFIQEAEDVNTDE